MRGVVVTDQKVDPLRLFDPAPNLDQIAGISTLSGKIHLNCMRNVERKNRVAHLHRTLPTQAESRDPQGRVCN
jgi:hypothetical protein